MALTGNAVKDTYLDLIQLEQSGAGLPSHAGAQAALYDGAGNQILGRTAQPHPNDPHPDAAAFAETFEFSTMADKNQTELESDGWTFVNCTDAFIADGVMWMVADGPNLQTKASIAVSLTGEFDITAFPVKGYDYDSKGNYNTVLGSLGVADTVNNTAYMVSVYGANGYGAVSKRTGAQWTDLSAGGAAGGSHYGFPTTTRIYRIGTSVRLVGGAGWPTAGYEFNYDVKSDGWGVVSTVTDANTMDKIFFTHNHGAAATGAVLGWKFLRRFK